jgi:hypothetical protein
MGKLIKMATKTNVITFPMKVWPTPCATHSHRVIDAFSKVHGVTYSTFTIPGVCSDSCKGKLRPSNV